jgi:hypothetical protein
MNKHNETQVFIIELKRGNFARISNQATIDNKLSSNAYRLLIFLLNNSEQWVTKKEDFSYKYLLSDMSRAIQSTAYLKAESK